jgi:hypothetical protein
VTEIGGNIRSLETGGDLLQEIEERMVYLSRRITARSEP